MSVLERENQHEASTENWTPGQSMTHQGNPTTRRVTFEVFVAEMETRAIERNREFHATIVERLAADNGDLVDAGDLLED